MQNHSHSDHAVPPKVSAQMLAQHQHGWHEFTRFVVANCVAVAGILVLLLLIFKVF